MTYVSFWMEKRGNENFKTEDTNVRRISRGSILRRVDGVGNRLVRDGLQNVGLLWFAWSRIEHNCILVYLLTDLVKLLNRFLTGPHLFTGQNGSPVHTCMGFL